MMCALVFIAVTGAVDGGVSALAPLFERFDSFIERSMREAERAVDAGPQLSAAQLHWSRLEARVRDGLALQHGAEKQLGGAEPRTRRASMVERVRTSRADALTLLHHPATQRAVDDAELVLAYSLERLQREVEDPTSEDTFDLLAVDSLACFKLERQPSHCRVDDDCAVVRAGCDFVGVDRSHRTYAEVLSDYCNPMCPANIKSAYPVAVCRAGRCATKMIQSTAATPSAVRSATIVAPSPKPSRPKSQSITTPLELGD